MVAPAPGSRASSGSPRQVCPQNLLQQTMQMLAALFVFVIVHVTHAQTGPCIGGICPTGHVCFNDLCYPSDGPCIGGLCPGGAFCETTSNACLHPTAPSTTSATVPPTGPATATTTAACVDLARAGYPSDCPANANLCNNVLYYDLMTRKCRKTCGRCGSSGRATTKSSTRKCVDKVGPKGYSDCPARAHLCTNSVYYALMTDQCPKTCRRC